MSTICLIVCPCSTFLFTVLMELVIPNHDTPGVPSFHLTLDLLDPIIESKLVGEL